MSSPLWSPSPTFKKNSNLAGFMDWLGKKYGLDFHDYQQVWEWSTNNVESFWEILLSYFDVRFDGTYEHVLTGDAMPHQRWFDGIALNYAEHVFRREQGATPAIVYQSETQPLTEISWKELRQRVTSLHRALLDAGVKEGDRVAACLPCSPEATVGFLATSALGAVWAGCSPDFGTTSMIDRFAQISPKVLIACTTYSYGGKKFDRTAVLQELVSALPSLQCVILVGEGAVRTSGKVIAWTDAVANSTGTLTFQRVPFSHPLWILFSSGTTGLPKAIVQGHGGILMEHLKYLTFHNDVKPGERFFWYTTTGWMMWNYVQSSLLCGATLTLYDGSPAYPDLNVLWKFAANARLHHFGTSAGFILSCRKAGLEPSRLGDLSSLRSVSSTGSTLPPEGFDWVYQHLRQDLWLASMSGGTDVCSAFVGGNPMWPVYSGEIQCRALGCCLEAFDDEGMAVSGKVGEMVITQPMPSMPVFFWNDPAGERYQQSYFERYPGVWCHGDWVMITEHDGVVIFGRSDATLNRGGVRIGTSEIYRAVDKIKEINDSLIVCLEKDHGEFYMPLFVQLREGALLTDQLKNDINKTIRSDYSPRHVPDAIIAVPAIPYTLSGKKTETPVKKILMGKQAHDVVSAGALRNPDSLTFFTEFYKTLSASS